MVTTADTGHQPRRSARRERGGESYIRRNGPSPIGERIRGTCWPGEWGRHFDNLDTLADDADGCGAAENARLSADLGGNLGRLSDGNGWTLVNKMRHPRVGRTHRGPWQCNLFACCTTLSVLKVFGVNRLGGRRTNLQWHLLPRTKKTPETTRGAAEGASRAAPLAVRSNPS